MRRTCAVGAACIALFWAAAAGAHERLNGIVLMLPAAGQAVIHHGAFGGMPAMTMTFRVPAQPPLQPGQRISADVDRSSQPWSLTNVTIAPGPSRTPAAAVPAEAKVGDAVPDAPFIDQLGRRVTLRSLRGAPLAISFIYTRCDDARMCPLVSAKFHALQRRVPRPAMLIEISLDPAYDRPPVLARYAAAFGADASRWRLLTGDPQTVLDAAARFGVLEEAAGPVKIVHSERLAIVGRSGRIVRFFDDAEWSPDDVLRGLQRAAAERL